MLLPNDYEQRVSFIYRALNDIEIDSVLWSDEVYFTLKGDVSLVRGKRKLSSVIFQQDRASPHIKKLCEREREGGTNDWEVSASNLVSQEKNAIGEQRAGLQSHKFHKFHGNKESSYSASYAYNLAMDIFIFHKSYTKNRHTYWYSQPCETHARLSLFVLVSLYSDREASR